MNCQVCGTEYQRTPHSRTPWCSAICRFTERVDTNSTDGCWEWTGATNRGGYGIFPFENRTRLAHRIGYELTVGPIPVGLQIDHLCRNRACVNPDHLEPVTAGENARRGFASAMVTHRTGICKRGHSMDDAIHRPYDGYKECRTCHNLRQRKNFVLD